MKINYILLAIIFLLIIALHTPGKAQSRHESNSPRFGIKGGVNLSNLNTKDGSDAHMLTGFNVGMFGKLAVTRNVAVQPELYFTVKGAEVTYHSLIVDGTARFRLNYIELPLLLVINITDHFNIHAGPYGSFLVSGQVKNVSNINLFNFEQNIDSNDYNRFDAGISAGVGIDVGFLSLGARYSYGLTNIGREKTFMGISYTVPDAKNGVINFYMSVSLN